MKKLFEVGDKIIEWTETMVGTCSLIGLTVLVFLQVFMRFLFRTSFAWTEELVTTLIVYMVFFGAARGVRRKEHTEVGGLANALPPYAGIALRILTNGITLAVLALMAYGSFVLAARATNKSIVLRYPLSINYYGVVLGGILMVYEYLKLLKSRILGR